MIGKVMIGKSFAGCVKYNVNKAEARILDAYGVRTESAQLIIHDFNMQRKLNPNLGQAVGHIALSWSIHDKDKLTPEIMVLRAKDYLQGMKIKDTQYLIVQHQDKEHPHIHIIYNRVNNKGKTISDKFQKELNGKITKELKLKYGYYLAENKDEVKRSQLKGADKVKYELYDQVSGAVKYAKGWQQLEASLKKDDINLIYKYKSGSKEIQGISFSKDEMIFKGSRLDRSLSYGNIDKQLRVNQGETLARTLRRTITENEQTEAEREQIYDRYQGEEEDSEIIAAPTYTPPRVLDDLLKGLSGNEVDQDDALKRRKRKGISR